MLAKTENLAGCGQHNEKDLAVLNYWVLGISRTKSDVGNKAFLIDSRAPVPSSRQARRRIGQRLEPDEASGIGIL